MPTNNSISPCNVYLTRAGTDFIRKYRTKEKDSKKQKTVK